MPVVRAALGDDVDDAAGRLAIFGVVAVGDDLEFLHRFLGDCRSNPIHSVIDVVHAVEIYEIGTCTLAAEIQS